MKKYTVVILLSFILLIIFNVYMIQPLFQGTANGPTIILILIFLWIITFSSVIFAFIQWKSGSHFPIFTFILLLGVWIFVLIFLESIRIQPQKTLNFITKNFSYYSKFTSNQKDLFNKEEKFYKLPYEYRFLSEDGQIELTHRNGVSHIFFTMKSSLGYREVLELSQVDKSLYEGDQYSKVIRLRKNWFFITQH